MTSSQTSRPNSRATSRSSPRARASRAAAAASQPDGIKDLVSRLKRERILSAAVDLFYERGFARTTLDEVAKSLGVTKPFIYQYFDSKNALLVEICSCAIRDAHETFNRTLTLRGTAAEKLRIIVRDFMLSVLTHQAHAVIYSREETELAPKDRELINNLRRDFDRRLIELLEEGVRQNEFAVEDTRLTAFVIASIVGWSPVWYRPGGRLTKEAAAESVASMVLTMVGARPAGQAPAPRQDKAGAKPSALKSAATKPAVTKPAVTKPAVPKSAVTKPAVPKPAPPARAKPLRSRAAERPHSAARD